MNRLQSNRIGLGISRSEMADRLGVSVYTIRAWEVGEKHIKVTDLATVTRAYNFSIVDLLDYIKESSNKGKIEYNL